MRISFTAAPHLRDGVVVVARGTPAFAQLDRGGWLSRAAGLAKGTVTLAAPPPPLARVVVVDRPEAGDRRSCRHLGAAIAVELAKLPGGLVSVVVDGADAAELAYGLRLRSYRPLRKYRTRPDGEESPGPDEVVVAAADPLAAEARHRRLDHVAQGVFLARDLTAEPGNVLGPAEFADRARLLAALGVDVQVIDPDAEGLGLLAAVGRGSARPPLLAVLRWNGGGGERPLALVGKGITFDAGGISIKPAEHMEEMKGDMAAAAAVLGALRAVAGRAAPVNVVGVLALAENMPSGRALRPGDVVRSYSGRTVEVIDTDAEGRLVLADALAWACRALDPAVVVDAATLTGAVVRTLGRHRAGLYTADDRLCEQLMEFGEAEDEPLWRLPLTEACDEDLKSDVADLRNCAWGKVPDNDDAARFLQHFVAGRTRWAHLDIAGVSETEEDAPLGPKGATGFGVRLFDALAGGDGAG